jgi:ribosomal protein S20
MNRLRDSGTPAVSGSYNYLTSLFSSSLGTTDPLLSALYGGGQSAGSTGQTPVQALKAAETNETKQVKATAQQSQVQQAVKAFTQAVKGAKSVKELLSNPAVMKVLLTANGMKDQIGYTALATQALTSKLSDPTALVNRLTDTRWKTLALTYNFASRGLKAIQNPAAIANVANAYAKATWEAAQDSVTPGLANALAFKAQASSITSVDQLLGNPTVRKVVTTALGIPEQIAFQELEAQEQAISSRLNIKKLQDPKFVENFAEQYLIASKTNAANASSSTPSMTTLAVQSGGFLA